MYRATNSRPSSRHLARGLTLIEVMIVVAIIAMVSGGVALIAIGQHSRAQLQQASVDARTVRSAVQSYFVLENTTTCPSAQQLAEAQVLDEASKLHDPWGGSWLIECDGSRVRVSSAGPDRQRSNEDDIAVPEQPLDSDG